MSIRKLRVADVMLLFLVFIAPTQAQVIPQTNWTLRFVDSEELVGEGASNGRAIHAFDGNSNTYWHTRWTGSSVPAHPHEIQINLGAVYSITGFRYLPMQFPAGTPGGQNGQIQQYEFYVSTDGTNWGTAAATGMFSNSNAQKEVTFAAKTGQYIRLRALSEINGNVWTSAGEINALGTLAPGNQAPNGVIDSPASNVTINVGGTVNFMGTGTDPENNPLTYLWNFGAGSGIANSTAADPGIKQFNNAGTYQVTFTVTDSLLLADPTPATRTITVQSGGSVISQANWTLRFVDSEELVGEGANNGRGIHAFDGNSNTYWHTRWTGSSVPAHPHEIQINLGAVYSITGFRYLPMQFPAGTPGGQNGQIKQYEFYISTDGTTWGTAVATGMFGNSNAQKEVTFAAKTGQYIRLRGLSEINANVWTSAAEINALGTAVPGNQAPNGVIDSPASNVTINVGGTVNFMGTGTDPNSNLPLTYVWNFGAGSGIANSTAEDPGIKQFNNAGTFQVTFTVTDSLLLADPTPATRTITVQSGGGVISQTNWRLKFADSQELVGEGTNNGSALDAFDGNPNTYWHTDWYVYSAAMPHELQINLGGLYNITGFRYLPMQFPAGTPGGQNGQIKQYEFYVSTDGTNWGTAAATGMFDNSNALKEISFAARTGQFVRLKSLSEINGNPWASAAEINVLASCITPSVRLVTPLDYHLQTSSTLGVQGNACLDPVANSGWGVRFTLDGATPIDDFTPPFSPGFGFVTAAEHTVDAVLINSSGNDFPGSNTQDQSSRVGRGDFYVAMGDSITAAFPTGDGDDVPADDTSLDGRNAGGGYTPILNNLLTTARGYPHTIINHGFGGTRSLYGSQLAPVLVSLYPTAQTYLILYGTNDSSPFMPVPSGLGLNPGNPGYAGSFKANMQQMITTIKNAGKSVVLAKIPIALADCTTCTPYPNPLTGQRNQLIQNYNLVIDELRAANSIVTVAPDFYAYFSQHYGTQYADPLHPNGIGYQSMATMWCQALTGTPCGGQ